MQLWAHVNQLKNTKTQKYIYLKTQQKIEDKKTTNGAG